MFFVNKTSKYKTCEKLFSFVAGEGQGKWSPSSLEGVCLIWCCWDAMVTGTAENKLRAPGGLFLFSSPHFPVHFWYSNRRLKVEGSCVSASKRTRGQSLLIWARKPNLPSYTVGYCYISRGDAVWGVSSSFGLVSHQQEMKGRWMQHTQWRFFHKLIGFSRRGGTNWDP